MKRIFYFVLAAVLCVAACQKVDQIDQVGEKSEVTFTVNLPGSIESKAISDGLKALKLYYATYTDQGKLIESLSNTADGVAVSGKKATVTLKLVKNLNYDVVFWAQAEQCSAFAFDWQNAVMTVDYNGEANDDYRDAFYAVRQDLMVTDGMLQETVYLYRPFAQINFGAADYQSVVDYYDQASVDAGMESALVCAQVPNTLNLLDETLGTSVAAADFTLAAIPDDPRLLNVNNTDYKYVAMNYVLAPKGTQPDMLGSITANFQYTAGNINRSVEVKNVPYLRNHRTNIVGNFFTETAILNIVIDERFEEPDYNMILPVETVAGVAGTETSPAELETVMAAINTNPVAENYIVDLQGGYMTWQTGSAHGSTPFVEATNSTVKTITIQNGTIIAQGAGVGPIRMANGGTLILNSVTVIDETKSYNEVAWELTYLEFAGKLQCNNCTFNSGVQFAAGNGSVLDATFDNCRFITNESSVYAVWVSDGNTTFNGCTFEGTRGLKMHEYYGSEIESVIVDKCTFGPLSEKPGIAIGALNAATKVSITDSVFDNCQAGDQNLHSYETDTDVTTFDFTYANNNII